MSLINSNTAYPSMDLPQGPNDSPDIVLGSRIVLNRLKEINNSRCTKSDCLIVLHSVTDDILNEVKDPWDIVRGGPAAVPPGRELVITAAEEERREKNNKVSATLTSHDNGRHFTYSGEQHNVEQEGVNVYMGLESYRGAENNAGRRQRHETLKRFQRRRNDLWQKLPSDDVPCTHSQSKNKLSEMYCCTNPQSLSFRTAAAMTEKKCSNSMHLCHRQEERVQHEYPPPSHEEPESVKIKDEEVTNLSTSDIPKQAVSYQLSSDCSDPKEIESYETPPSSHVVPELKMIRSNTSNGKGKLCAEENEEEGISVDLSNCHFEKLKAVLKEGQRRRDTAL